MQGLQVGDDKGVRGDGDSLIADRQCRLLRTRIFRYSRKRVVKTERFQLINLSAHALTSVGVDGYTVCAGEMSMNLPGLQEYA